MQIKPGWGYWDLEGYPLGGSFRRSPKDGIPCEMKEKFISLEYGILAIVVFQDGKRAAVSQEALSD